MFLAMFCHDDARYIQVMQPFGGCREEKTGKEGSEAFILEVCQNSAAERLERRCGWQEPGLSSST